MFTIYKLKSSISSLVQEVNKAVKAGSFYIVNIPGPASCVPDSGGVAGEEADLPGGGGGDGEDHHD